MWSKTEQQMSLELLALGGRGHGKDVIISPNKGDGRKVSAVATGEEPTAESSELATKKALDGESTKRKRRNVNPNNETTSLRFSAHTVLNVLVPEDDFRRLGLPEGSHVTITIDADSIPEDEKRSQLLARESEFLLPKGTLVIAKVRDSERISKADRAYGDKVAKTAPSFPDAYQWSSVIPVEIVLLEDLSRSTRVHGSRRLRACRCSIPYLKVEARSLNHALSLIIRHFEPSRISSSGNAFKEIYTEVRPKEWRLLDEIPTPPASPEK